MRKGTHLWSPGSPMKTFYDSSVWHFQNRFQSLLIALRWALHNLQPQCMRQVLTTQQTLLLFTEMLRLVLVVFATVQEHRPLKEELLLTPLLSLCGSRVWHRHLEAGGECGTLSWRLECHYDLRILLEGGLIRGSSCPCWYFFLA